MSFRVDLDSVSLHGNPDERFSKIKHLMNPEHIKLKLNRFNLIAAIYISYKYKNNTLKYPFNNDYCEEYNQIIDTCLKGGEKNDSKEITYFKETGKINTDDTIKLSIARAKELNIKKILVFTADGIAPLNMVNYLQGSDIKIYAVSFPNQLPFYRKEEDQVIEFFAKTSEEDVKKKLEENNITLIQGVMPFEEIVIPGAPDSRGTIIKETLSLISGGLNLCIQAVIMATDSGHVLPGEDVISMSADTSIIVNGVNSRYLFHPLKGLQIKEIICKPLNLSITRH
jgi:uncharacterized protein